MEIFDNPSGVTTNGPKLPWQLQNLSSYINLNAKNSKPLRLGDAEIVANSSGSGMVGLPGDITSKSRFIRITEQKNSVVPAQSIAENVNLAFHLLIWR